MSLINLISGIAAQQAPVPSSSQIFNSLLWRLLLVLAVLFLIVAIWRILEAILGPILTPLIMASALALTAALFAGLEARRKQRRKEESPSIAPVVATLMEIAFAPKIVRWLALGTLVYDVLTGSSPLTPKAKARTPRR